MERKSSDKNVEQNVNEEEKKVEEPLKQYVVIRKDLKWPLGSIVSQGCHACTSVVFQNLENERIKKYFANISSLHKVVLGCKDDKELLSLSEKLRAEGFIHQLWIEQPENICTSIATLPYKKSEIHHIMKKYQLLK